VKGKELAVVSDLLSDAKNTYEVTRADLNKWRGDFKEISTSRRTVLLEREAGWE